MSNFTDEQIIDFANHNLVRPDNAFQNALLVMGGDTPMSFRLVNEAPREPLYIQTLNNLQDEKSTELPTKDGISRLVYDIANNSTNDSEVRLKAIELYAKINSMIEKPTPQIAVQTNTTNKVMILQSAGTDEEWELKAEKQQKLLTGGA